MRPLRTLLLVSIAALLAGCAASGSRTPPPPQAPTIPALPADVLACVRAPSNPPDRDLNAGEVERLWSTDRLALVKVNGCLRRAICHNADIRREIGREADATCEPQPLPRARPLAKRKKK